ncbi:MAG: DUF3240 family protein [Colwellia sp.]|nr:DUF3240 family protein [Colwellia sp.]NQY86227.1 DUF3240 family protein [Colwellia sp.]
MSEQLFILISPKELKDELVDLFMSMKQLSGFNLKKINGYSQEHSNFNITEQVEGYREFYQFEVLIKDDDKEAMFNQLTPICQAAKLRYWLLPISKSGHF